MDMKKPVNEEILKYPVRVANRMWRDYIVLANGHGGEKWLEKEGESKMQYFREKGYGDFIKTYLIVSRQLICNGEYNQKAFKRYVKYLRSDDLPGGAEGWSYTRAMYMKYLFLELNKKTPNVKKDAKKIFEATKDNLFNETTQFKKDLKEAEEEVKNVKKERCVKIREEMIRMIRESSKIRKSVQHTINNLPVE